MKNLKKLNRENLKSINGGNVCYENCPPGPYGPAPDYPRSCDDYNALPACCKLRVLVDYRCSDPF